MKKVEHFQVHSTSIRNTSRTLNIEHDHVIIFQIYLFIFDMFIFKFESTFRLNLRSRSQNTNLIKNAIPIKICDCIF